MSLTIVIPVYNEAESLSVILPKLRAFIAEQRFKLILVNDGSTDNSGDLMRQFCEGEEGISIVNHKINKGYGSAIKSGILAADTQFVITIDADGQHRNEDVLDLYKVIKDKDADMIIGGRLHQKSATFMRGIGKWIIRRFTRFIIKLPVKDINSGMKIYRTNIAKRLIRIAPDNMAFSDIMTISFVHFGHYVLELPIKVNPRLAGKSTIGIKTAFDTIKEIIFIGATFAPYKFFSFVSFFILIISFCWGLPFLIYGKGLTTATAIGFIFALLFWSLGIITQLISEIRKELLELR